MSTNTQIDAYRMPREIKQHDQELRDLLTRHNAGFSGRMLDIGCAAGAFIGFASDQFPDASYVGFDISAELIEMATRNHDKPNCSFVVADALNYTPQDKFDIIIASGVLSIYEEFQEPLQRWLSWLAKGGTLYVFGRFNSRDIDTIIRFRNNSVGSDWEGGLTSYSTHTVGRFLSERGYAHEFQRFKLQVDLAETTDPIRTFTTPSPGGDRIVMNGANIIAEHHFLIVHG